MKTYRVTVVRMVEGTAIVSASNPYEAKLLAEKGRYDVDYDLHTVGFEVVGEPILCENPDGEEVK